MSVYLWRMVLAFIVVIQFVERGLANWIDRKSNFISSEVNYALEMTFGMRAIDTVRDRWREFSARPGIEVIRYLESRTNDMETRLQAVVRLSESRVRELTPMAQTLSTVDGVTSAEWSRSSVAEDDRD